nr:MAG TPA: hypothetical protein [Caudoviricetes sp.]
MIEFPIQNSIGSGRPQDGRGFHSSDEKQSGNLLFFSILSVVSRIDEIAFWSKVCK